MDREHLWMSLAQWITVHFQFPHTTAQEFSDGVTIAKVLSQIAPEYFHDGWIATITFETYNKNILKVRNLSKIYEKIQNYFEEILDFPITDFGLNVGAIVEENNEIELGRLLQLVIGCAVRCEKRQEYVNSFSECDNNVQEVIMYAIQELFEAHQSMNIPDDHRNNTAELQARIRELESHCSQLSNENSDLASRNNNLVAEIKDLKKEISTNGANEDQLAKLKKDMTRAQKELEIAEINVDEYRRKAADLERSTLAINAKYLDSEKQLKEVKDELDAANSEIDTLKKKLPVIDSLTEKLERKREVEKQLKIANDRISEYVNQMLEFEDEIKKKEKLIQRTSEYKANMDELELKLLQQTSQTLEVNGRLKELQGEIVKLQDEKNKLVAERNHYKQKSEEYPAPVPKLEVDDHPGPGPSFKSVDFDGDVHGAFKIKEQLIRLEREHNKLQNSYRDKNDEITGMKERLHVVEEENRILKSQPDVSGRNNGLEQVLIAKSANIEQLKSVHEIDTKTIQELRAELDEKDHKLNSYLERAREVVQNLNPDIEILQSQLKEKEKRIKDLELSKEKELAVRDKENKVMATAFYNLGMHLQRQNVDERFSATSGLSFLARQRQATTRRIGHSNSQRGRPSDVVISVASERYQK